MTSCNERRIGKTLDGLADNRFSFRLVVAALTFCVYTLDSAPLNSACTGLCRRKGDQIAVVVTVIRERDQAFMATAVVPAQTVAWHPCPQAFVQDALHVFGRIVVTGIGPTAEEVRRWHLTRVTSDHHLLAASNRTDCVPWSNLRCLVEDDQVEWGLIGRQELRNRKRAHEHARRQAIQCIPHFNSQLPDGFVSTRLLQFMLENCEATALWNVIL